MTENDQTETEPSQSVEPNESDAVASNFKFKPLRSWPPILFLIGMLVTRFLTQVIEVNSTLMLMVVIFGPMVFGGLILLWWLFASRATVKERIVGTVVVVLAAIATMLLIDPSMKGPAVMSITVPMGLGLFGLAAILVSKMLSFKRTVIIVACSVIGFGFSTLVRSDGMWGHYEMDLAWRWTPSAEDSFLASDNGQPQVNLDQLTKSEFDQQLNDPVWPAFRGGQRDGVLSGVTLADKWTKEASTPLWRIAIGPGWSSFAIAGDLLFTQEQRGDQEAIVCYDARSGNEVWKQEIQSRFYEPMGGAGPRATPTLANGQLYIMGAKGHLLRLDPKTGKIVWQQDLREIAGREPPMWGFSSSPLVVDSLVIVHAGGKDDKGILAFDTETGDLKWSAPSGDHSYSSPALLTVAGQSVVAMLTNKELNLFNPADGAMLLNYECAVDGFRALQPQVIEDDSILIATGMGKGVQRVRVTNTDGKWEVEQVWIARGLKPDFSDYVIHEGYAYGFDGSIFLCFDLKDGKRKWKRGRYGKGQVLLLGDSGQLLVISELGEVVLLKADPTTHTELAKFQSIDGKTWNHPVMKGGQLFVRNAEQAASYRLPLAK